jgi:hypothetical protein
MNLNPIDYFSPLIAEQPGPASTHFTITAIFNDISVQGAAYHAMGQQAVFGRPGQRAFDPGMDTLDHRRFAVATAHMRYRNYGERHKLTPVLFTEIGSCDTVRLFMLSVMPISYQTI